MTVVGGYLGAGKTTLINRLLGGEHGRRLAVLVNDFGSINIDADLIQSHDGTTISLSNGCVCCSIADALGDGLDAVLAIDQRPDQIVIEASGAADPGKIATYGRGWPGCRLDAVLTLVDVTTIRARLTDQFVGQLVSRQLAEADLVLLTKIDLTDRATLDGVKELLVGFTNAPLVELTADAGAAELALDLAPRPARPHAGAGGRHQTTEPGVVEIDAEQLFRSLAIDCPMPIEPERLTRTLARWPESIVRVKGIVELAGTDGSSAGLAVVQRVGRRVSIEPLAADHRSTSNHRGLMVIGLRATFDPQAIAGDLMEGER